eukprot:Gregarina_sp_Poly_1__9843@NODE_634_length_7031_cov_50_167289_g484_i0_p1_GENE_NODE_634_length_7031_cov_50_167289_g484_i0NODE_634_length_7031_cov_50_167289_g484_i0_p1_ORF_typecomplete_len843_score56_70_NODE_634_length_7031_cov_50_167289_g484_i044446972
MTSIWHRRLLMNRLCDKRLYTVFIREDHDHQSTDDENLRSKRYFFKSEISLYTRLAARLKSNSREIRSHKAQRYHHKLHKSVFTEDYIKLQTSKLPPLNIDDGILINSDLRRWLFASESPQFASTDFSNYRCAILSSFEASHDQGESKNAENILASRVNRLEQLRFEHQTSWSPEGQAVVDILLWDTKRQLKKVVRDNEDVLEWVQLLCQRYGSLFWIWDYAISLVENRCPELSDRKYRLFIQRLLEIHCICRDRCSPEYKESHLALDRGIVRIMYRLVRWATKRENILEARAAIRVFWICFQTAAEAAQHQRKDSVVSWLGLEDMWNGFTKFRDLAVLAPKYLILLCTRSTTPPNYSDATWVYENIKTIESLSDADRCWFEESEYDMHTNEFKAGNKSSWYPPEWNDQDILKFSRFTLSSAFFSPSSLAYAELLQVILSFGVQIDVSLLSEQNMQSQLMERAFEGVSTKAGLAQLGFLLLLQFGLIVFNDTLTRYQWQKLLVQSAQSVSELKFQLRGVGGEDVLLWIAGACRMFSLGDYHRGRVTFQNLCSLGTLKQQLSVIACWCHLEVKCAGNDMNALVDQLTTCLSELRTDSIDRLNVNIFESYLSKFPLFLELCERQSQRSQRVGLPALLAAWYLKYLSCLVLQVSSAYDHRFDLMRKNLEIVHNVVAFRDQGLTSSASVELWCLWAVESTKVFRSQILSQTYRGIVTSTSSAFPNNYSLLLDKMYLDIRNLPILKFLSLWGLEAGVTLSHTRSTHLRLPSGFPGLHASAIVQASQQSDCQVLFRWLARSLAHILGRGCDCSSWLTALKPSLPLAALADAWGLGSIFCNNHAFHTIN